jgi:Tol biopolymer transport system component/serine/threonine protein kinase
MTPERWQQIESLFHSALESVPAERARFLDQACNGDTALRDEVVKLLASLEDAGEFIEQPLIETMETSASSRSANVAPPESMIGKRIGSYEILSLIGAGGMGEVYLARDERLNRQIALKFLPSRFSEYSDLVERFAHEARAASALNHPNIITIHDIGQDAGRHFIAMEFVAGETLRQKLKGGSLELREALRIATQIASALAAAHAAGIVHKDIKPENVVVRTDGLAKLLDFGLAVSAGEKDSGLLMGTPGYLSPEQARGETTDHRTDIFSLGVVLYEMLTGQKPAEKRKTDWPFDLERILNRALADDRAARYQNADELHRDLQRQTRKVEAMFESGVMQPIQPKAKTNWKIMAMALAAVVAVCVAGWWFWRSGNGDQKDISSPWINAAATRLTGFAGNEFFPAIAPDGQSFVYARAMGQQFDIFHQRFGEAQPRNLTADSGVNDWMAAFSRDGSRIAFRSDRNGGGIFVMDADGGNLRQLTKEGFNPSWSPNGEEIVYATSQANSPHSRSGPNGQLRVVKLATGEIRNIDLANGADAVQPTWSPNGARIAFWGLRGTHRDIWTVAAGGGQPVAVTNDDATDWNPVWSPDGQHLYFASDSRGAMRFWRVPINQTTGEVLGEREAVTGSASESWHPGFSRDGKRLVYVNYLVKEVFYRVAFDPQKETILAETLTPLTGGERRVTAPQLSPDGEWLAYYTFGSPQEDIFVMKKDGSEPRQLTNDRHRDRVPRWSPDGKQLAFYSDRSGSYEIWAINSDGSGLRQLTRGNRRIYYPVWSPNEKRLAFYNSGLNTFLMEPDKSWDEQTPEPLPPVLDKGGHLEIWSWSPNGEKLAGVWQSPGVGRSGLTTYSLVSRRYESITSFGADPVWLSDNRRLLFINNFRLYLVDSQTKEPRQLFSLDPLRIALATISSDDRHIYLSVISPESDIQMLTLN